MKKHILVEVADAVAMVTLNRPERLNALDATSNHELADALERCATDQGVRAVVLTGAGRAFCAGGDMKAVHAHIERGDAPADYFRDLTLHLNRAVLALRVMEKPTIAAVNGVAMGAGLSLAMACDLRVAGRSGQLRPAYGSIAQVPGGGWSYIVPRLVGAARAFDLLYAPRVLDAEAAMALGLVSQVVDDAALATAARDRALTLARGPTTAFAGAKALINAGTFAELASHLELERERILAQAETAEFRAALLAFIDKKDPSFGPARRDG